MIKPPLFPSAAWAVLALAATATADPPDLTPEQVKFAVGRAMPLIARSAAEYTKHRDCFSCHHQAVPVVALVAAKGRGFAVEPDWVRQQLEHTQADLEGAAEDYRKGRGQGGGVTRAGYALWALEAGGWAPDETTAAVAEFFLRRDKDGGRWRTSSNRPPSEASEFTTTYLALRGLKSFGTPAMKDRIADRIEAARGWLSRSNPRDTEDRAFRLWALKLAGAADEQVRHAARELLDSQRVDGGWSQLADRDSDAYATGTALVALHEAAGLGTDEPSYRRGLAFLVQSQLPDGSWYVRSRSKPFQLYFESGFPHGRNQFISIAASAWATYALALACPE
jgi:hypothetical protein